MQVSLTRTRRNPTAVSKCLFISSSAIPCLQVCQINFNVLRYGRHHSCIRNDKSSQSPVAVLVSTRPHNLGPTLHQESNYSNFEQRQFRAPWAKALRAGQRCWSLPSALPSRSEQKTALSPTLRTGRRSRARRLMLLAVP